ncbi:MAG: aminoglycoside phosphotransferase family protein [Candidatus Heimdallarchaeota archaeon]|nr:aminoglycoside phosphotransferase family protein [Candidatus Heimdallarchaeota archaeon]
MRSVTQQVASEKDIQDIIRHHFDNTPIGMISLLSDGWYSVAYDVELPEMDFDVIIKLDIPDPSHTQIYEHSCLRTEVESIEFLKNQDFDLPLPDLLGYDLIGDLIGRGYMVTRKFRGHNLDSIKKKLRKNQLEHIDNQIGQLHRKLHSQTHDQYGYFIDHPQYPTSSSTWYSSFSKMMLNLFEDARIYDVTLPFDTQEVISLLDKSQDSFDMVEKPCYIHWDLWYGNIFVIEKNGSWEIEGIIDFERAIWGDPLMESLFRGQKKNMNVILGYQNPLLEDDHARFRDAWYDLYLGTLMYIEAYVRQYSFIIRIGFKQYCKKFWKPALQYLKQSQTKHN